MYSVPQEIHYLSQLTCIKCDQFRHVIITANKLDPLEYDPASAREAHIFTTEGSPEHQAFDAAVRGIGAIRKTDCMPEPGMEPNLCYLSPTSKTEEFELLAAGLNLQMQWGILPVSKALLSYNPPENLTWIVTYIFLRSMNPTDYLGGTPFGDMRSDDFDWNGFTTAWLTVKNKPIFAEAGIVSFGLFNKPLLLAFQGGQRVKLTVQRALLPTPSLPEEAFQVHVAMHGYLAPANALSALSDNVTRIEQKTAV